MNSKTLIKNNDSYKKILKSILKMGILIGLQSALISLVQLIDNLFIGHLPGATYVAAALNAINNMTFVINMIIVGFIGGIGIYFTQFRAEKDFKKLQEIFKYKIIWAGLLSFTLLTISMFFLKPIASLWVSGKDPILKQKTLKFASEYGYIIFPSLLLDYFCLMFSSSFKESKNAKMPVAIAIVAIIINSCLNYPLIYVAKLGVEGSAISTLIARFSEALIWIGIIIKFKPDFLFAIKHTFTGISFKRMLFYSKKPFFWMLSSFSIGASFATSIAMYSSYSLVAGASLNAAGAIAQLCLAFVSGYTAATSILLNHKMVEFKKDNLRLRKYINKIIVISIIYTTFFGLIILPLAFIMPYLYKNYTTSAIFNSQLMLYSISISFPISVVGSVYNSTLKASGHSKSMFAVNLLINWAILVPLVILLTQTGWVNLSIGYLYWIAQSTGALISAIIWSFFYFIRRKELKPTKKFIEETKQKTV